MNGSTVIAPDRSRRVGGSWRRPTTSRCSNRPVDVVLVRIDEEGERFAGHRVGVERAEQSVEVGGRERRPVGLLERPHVEHDPDPGGRRRGRDTKAANGAGRSRPVQDPRRRRRPSSSSARSWTTTTSASTTIRRLIFDWPTRRSRKVIGISRMRAPPRLGAIRHLDLEDVAAGVDAVERDRRERGRAPGLEPAGQVVLAEPEDDPREQAAAARDDPTPDAPVDHAAALR